MHTRLEFANHNSKYILENNIPFTRMATKNVHITNSRDNRYHRPELENGRQHHIFGRRWLISKLSNENIELDFFSGTRVNVFKAEYIESYSKCLMNLRLVRKRTLKIITGKWKKRWTNAGKKHLGGVIWSSKHEAWIPTGQNGDGSLAKNNWKGLEGTIFLCC